MQTQAKVSLLLAFACALVYTHFEVIDMTDGGKNRAASNLTEEQSEENIGKRIRDARKAAGMTQAELADKLGISYQGITQWENGLRNPKYESLCKIADAIGITVGELMGRPEESGCEESKKIIEIDGYERLNQLGKEKVKAFVDDLLLISKYRK